MSVRFRGGRRGVLAGAAVLFAIVTALRFAAGDDPSTGVVFLYVVPIALVAVEAGAVGGLLTAAAGVALFAMWTAVSEADVGPAAYVTRAAAFVVVGGGVGWFSARRTREHRRSERWFGMSNDLLCEASFDGHFTKLNGAWTECLGYTTKELCSRPYVELIHPDDVEPTTRVAGTLGEGPANIVNFENRYRHRDGSWRWLLWSARSDSDRVYAVAKDITERKLLEEERARLLQRVEAMARTDELTGLPNRRGWEEELRRELARAQRYGYRMAVAVLDLDRFKEFNDEHGHQAGDELLRECAAAWRLTLRVSDFVARYGGEEFAVLVPRCPPANAAEVLDRLRAVTPGSTTFSAGVALWDGEEPAEALVGRADEALYAAKREGRNRTSIDGAARSS